MKTTFNGYTFRQITAQMHKQEQIIAFYNHKYNYDIDLASEKEKKHFDNTYDFWYRLKTIRDNMKANA